MPRHRTGLTGTLQCHSGRTYLTVKVEKSHETLSHLYLSYVSISSCLCVSSAFLCYVLAAAACCCSTRDIRHPLSHAIFTFTSKPKSRKKKRAKKNQLNPHPASADRRPLRIERRALLSSALCVTNPSLMCFFPLPESLLVLMDMLSVFSLGFSNPCNALYVPVRSPPESAKWRRVDGGWGNVGVYIFR